MGLPGRTIPNPPPPLGAPEVTSESQGPVESLWLFTPIPVLEAPV